MRRKKEEIEEIDEEQEEELSEKELKKLKQKEIVEKRKNAKKKDKIARWGGIILLGLVMLVGFLLWVSGEMKQDSFKQTNEPTYKQTNVPGGTGSVILK